MSHCRIRGNTAIPAVVLFVALILLTGLIRPDIFIITPRAAAETCQTGFVSIPARHGRPAQEQMGAGPLSGYRRPFRQKLRPKPQQRPPAAGHCPGYCPELSPLAAPSESASRSASAN